ncbi:hypothetical protein Vadar_017936 [Vaccinium darrowii]|uniref:Uncharacterized protein n=1 Tax=Vaccinium darrowii TaxID=229202 RepID=A0ACB7Z4L0_9ERIC|nr:hypothetical protein Vadar_017936 [Vaccinium darrowii]
MKKLLNSKGKVHPSPPPPAAVDQNRFSFLPATILTLTLSLSVQDKEVLAYLISCSGHHYTAAGGGSSGGDHSPQFNCNCFSCYMSYWVKWDTSPNRELIHQILDEYEDGLLNKKKKLKVKKERRKRGSSLVGGELKSDSGDSGELESVEVSGKGDEEEVVVKGEEICEVGSEKGAVRKVVSFIGERIWGVWGV